MQTVSFIFHCSFLISHSSKDWWLKSDAGLLARILIGVAIFTILAVYDLAKNGRRATRWREYAFLLVAVAMALMYGVVNDLSTSRISWEYFYYGKGLFETLGPRTPPNSRALAWEAAKIGLKATWTAGAIAGVALLLANNPQRDRPRLPDRRLLVLLLSIFAIVIPCAALLGLAGYGGKLTWISADFRDLVRDDLFRPRRFLCAFGIHLGAYVGGALGTAWAVWRVLRERSVES